jgi:retinol dehydrogenase 12
VTGANTGIGEVTARELACKGAHVFLACRSESKTRPVVEAIRHACGHDRVEFLPLDLGDFDSVQACAQTFLRRDLPLHLLINNAGVAGARGMTRSGFEIAFGINHMGHFLLTQRLLDRLRRSTPARIVTVASQGHYRAKGIDFEAVRRSTASLTGLPEYNTSKLANVLFSSALARRLAGSGVTTYSLHPGVVATDVWRQVPWPVRPLMKRFMISSEEGARTTLYCATSDNAASETGLYYDNCQVKRPGRAARDEGLAEALWQHSEAWIRHST